MHPCCIPMIYIHARTAVRNAVRQAFVLVNYGLNDNNIVCI